MLPPSTGPNHPADRHLAPEPNPLEIDSDGGVKLGFGLLEDRAVAVPDTRVVDHDVQPAPLLGCYRCGTLHVGGPAHVGLHENRLSPGGPDQFDGRCVTAFLMIAFTRARTKVRNQHPGPLPREATSDSPADPGTGAGDQSNLAFERARDT